MICMENEFLYKIKMEIFVFAGNIDKHTMPIGEKTFTISAILFSVSE